MRVKVVRSLGREKSMVIVGSAVRKVDFVDDLGEPFVFEEIGVLLGRNGGWSLGSLCLGLRLTLQIRGLNSL